MITSMTWVRDPRSTFELPIFDKPDLSELAVNLPNHAQSCSVDIRLGSKADIEARPFDVHFTPESGHQLTALGCPLSAKR